MANQLTQHQLDPHTVDIRQNGETLLLVVDSQEHPVDHAVRCFPFSTPNKWISLRDEKGSEIGLLPTLDGLNEKSKALLETYLKDRYYIPSIESIREIEGSKQGGTIWHVHTQDGPMSFTMRGDRSLNLNAFPEVVFTDAITRKRYKILDFTKLDRASQKIARVHLPMGSRHSGRGRGGRGRSR